MPRTRAPGKRSRVSRAKPDPFIELAKQVHLPMIEARAFLRALYLMGHGMNEQGHEDGDTVLALAEAAAERLDVIDDNWHELYQLAQR